MVRLMLSLGMLAALALATDGSQAGVVGGVAAAAGLDGHDHFAGDLGEDLRALGVSRALGFLYVVPLGVSGHNIVPFCLFALVIQW